MTEQRRLAAILVADVVGYSRRVGQDEAGTLTRLAALRRDVIEPAIARHSGRLFKAVGDGFLVEFASAVQAVTAARAIQEANAASGLSLRIGIHVGDVVVEGDDLMGDGVNIAARIEGVAEAGGIAISRAVHEQVRDKLDAAFVDKGEVALKNLTRPVQVFALVGVAATTADVPALALPDKPSIAVLPFQNMSGDPEQEYFADGMVEDIITALSRSRGFFVIARNSSFTYKGKSPDIRQVGRELGVHYVLEGSVRKSGPRLRVTVQLIDAATGNHLWAERYDRAETDVFAIQDEITESVVASIEPQLLLAEGTATRGKRPTDLDAWGYVTRAYTHRLLNNREDCLIAYGLLERAIECDPHYARAHAELSLLLSQMAYNNWHDDRSHAFEAATASARRAVALDSNDPWSYYASGTAAALARHHEEALPGLMKAVELNPNFALAHSRLGPTLTYLGRAEEGIEHAARALRISPRDPQRAELLNHHGLSLFAASRYAEAIAAEERACQERLGYPQALRVLTACRALHGDIAGARVACRDLQLAHPGITLAWIDRNVEGPDWLRPRLLEGLRLAGLPE
ncbi:MAG: adenylate/guanylate cyclase domain-containing protein [Hyphomicrobiaceae bacterium]